MSEFTWEDVIDPYIDRYGIVFLYGTGRAEAIQRFCEDLSNLIGFKCDWSFAAGRFRMKVDADGLDAVKVAFEDPTWIQRYVREYSQESAENDTYFMPYVMPCVKTEFGPEHAEEALYAYEEKKAIIESTGIHWNADGTVRMDVTVHTDNRDTNN